MSPGRRGAAAGRASQLDLRSRELLVLAKRLAQCFHPLYIRWFPTQSQADENDRHRHRLVATCRMWLLSPGNVVRAAEELTVRSM